MQRASTLGSATSGRGCVFRIASTLMSSPCGSPGPTAEATRLIPSRSQSRRCRRSGETSEYLSSATADPGCASRSGPGMSGWDAVELGVIEGSWVVDRLDEDGRDAEDDAYRGPDVGEQVVAVGLKGDGAVFAPGALSMGLRRKPTGGLEPPTPSLRAFPATLQARRGRCSPALPAAVGDPSRLARRFRGRHMDAATQPPVCDWIVRGENRPLSPVSGHGR
jgi:hypothetical protein